MDVILLSNYHNILALPYVTECTGFKGVIYATEPTLHIGRYIMSFAVDWSVVHLFAIVLQYRDDDWSVAELLAVIYQYCFVSHCIVLLYAQTFHGRISQLRPPRSIVREVGILERWTYTQVSECPLIVLAAVKLVLFTVVSLTHMFVLQNVAESIERFGCTTGLEEVLQFICRSVVSQSSWCCIIQRVKGLYHYINVMQQRLHWLPPSKSSCICLSL